MLAIDRHSDLSVRAMERQASLERALLSTTCIVLTVAMGTVAYLTAPRTFGLALGVFFVGAIAIVVRPAAGVYLIAFLGALGDSVTTAWYPFLKNMSSNESALFVTSGLSVSPAEVYLALTFTVWIVSMAVTRRWVIVRGPVFWPLLAFAGFGCYAAFNGITSGGDVKIALFELRPLLLLAGLYILGVNLLTTRRQWRGVIWLLMLAILINSILSIGFLRGLTGGERADLESLIEHPAAVQINLMFVIVVFGLTAPRCSPGFRKLLPLMAIPPAYVYLVSQRRSAVIGLGAAAAMGAVVMFWQNRRLFWRLMPVCALIGALYLAAFWSVESGPGFPAQAVKAVIAPEQTSARDQSSDIYRILENVNLLYTIKAQPLKGIGFGVPFFRPVALPDISTFVYWEYIPHNSIMAVWMKMGVGGFFAVLALFAAGMRAGAHAIRRTARDDDGAIVFGATTFIAMFGAYAYVDIAWDARSMVYLALCFAIVATFLRTAPEAGT